MRLNNNPKCHVCKALDPSKKTFIFVSYDKWDGNWFSKHQIADTIHQMGHTVYFVDPPTPWKLGNGLRLAMEEIKSNFFVVKSTYPLPITIQSKLLKTKFDSFFYHQIEKKLDSLEEIIIWQFDPTRFRLKNLRAKRVYHVTDPIKHLQGNDEIAKSANHVICSSPNYLKYYKPLNENTQMFPHGIYNYRQLTQLEKKINFDFLPSKFALLIGTINKTVDLLQLIRLSQENIELVIAGPIAENSAEQSEYWNLLIGMKNVTYLGPIPAHEVDQLCQLATVGLVSYKFDTKNPFQSTRSPLKALHYIRASKPIISTINCEILELEGNGIHWVTDQLEFVQITLEYIHGKRKVNDSAYAKVQENRQLDRLILNLLKQI